jgi:hypothetical protein
VAVPGSADPHRIPARLTGTKSTSSPDCNKFAANYLLVFRTEDCNEACLEVLLNGLSAREQEAIEQ